MSAIINSIIARKNGSASRHYEEIASLTTGHASSQPGLRGHSIGDTFPWGVAGYGKGWIITKHGAPCLVARVLADGSLSHYVPAVYSVKLAHKLARDLSQRPELERHVITTDWRALKAMTDADNEYNARRINRRFKYRSA